jgi:hypothetical protein
MRMVRLLGPVALTLAATGAARAQGAADCVEDPARPVPSAWRTEPRTITDPRTAAMRPGERVRLTLRPVGEVGFAQNPERAPDAGTFGGVIQLALPAAGRWRVHMSRGGWIDAVQDGLRQASVAHGQWAACAGLPKAVEYRLRRGPARLQISGATGDAIDLLAVRVGD